MINDLDINQWDYLLSPEFELINSAGKPLTGGYIEVYIHGTRDKYYCALSFDGTLHPFQIPLDALGSNIILADPANAYDVYVYNKYGSLIMSRYNVHCQGGNGGSSAYVGDKLFYGQYRASNVTTVANLRKNKGNINLSSEGYLKLKEDMSYHITVRGAFKVDDVSNVDTTLNYIEYSSVNPIKVDVDYTKEGPQYFELSYDLYRLPEDMDYQVAFDESNGMVTDLIVEVHSLSNLATTAQGGEGAYDSGWGIDITNNIISVDPSILEDYVTAEEVIAIVSGVTGLTPGSEYTAGDYISIINNEISVTGINPEDYATHTEVYEATVTAVNTITGLIPEEEEVEFEEINLSDYALVSAIPDVSEYATHTEVYNSSVTAINTVTGLIPDVSDFTTHTEVYEATVTAVQVATGLIPELPDEEEVEFEEINLSDYALASAIPDVSDFTTHNEVHEAIVTAVNTVTSLIPDAQVQSDWAQETVTAVDFIKNKPDEIEIIAGQNIGLFEGEGTLTIAASAVDLSDYTTFEDVMEIVTGVTGLNDYGQFYATSVTGTAEMSRTKGTIALTNDGKLKLIKGSSYHITVRGRYDVATAVNTFTDVSYIEAITNTGIHVNVDNTITDSQYFELSYDLYKLNADTDYTVSFTGLAGSINNLYLEIHSLDGIGGGGSGPVTGGGVEYDAGWGINILNNVISVDSSILNNYATKDELQDSIELVTGLIPQSQVQSDWTEIDNSDPAYIKNKPQQVNLVAGQNIGIAVTGANIVISASATDLSDYATHEQLQDSVELVTGLIPDVSDFVTDTELQSAISIVREEIPTIQLNANNQVTAIDNYEIAGGSVTGTFVQVQSNWTEDDDSEPSYIQNKPSEQSLVAGNGISLTSSGNTVIISAEVPTVTGFVTEAQLQSVSGTLQDEIEAVSGAIPDEEEVEFEELDLSDYALASAIPDISTLATKTELSAVSGKLPTTEVGKFTIQNNVSGGPIEVIIPTDDLLSVSGIVIDNTAVSGYVITSDGPIMIFKSPGFDQGYWNGTSEYTLVIDLPEPISYSHSFFWSYASNNNPTSIGYTVSLPSSTTETHFEAIMSAQHGYGETYGQYLQLFIASNPSDYQTGLSILEGATIKILGPVPIGGNKVVLDRYYLGNTSTITYTSGYTQACVYTDPTTKKQSVYLPSNMPSNWSSSIVQSFEYGSNYNSPSSSSYNTKRYMAYKYTSSPRRYQFAYCTDWDYANSIMTFIAYDNSGNAIEKWTLNYATYISNIWTTTPISSGGASYTAGTGIDITNNIISVDDTVYIPYSASGVYLPNSKFEIDTNGQAYKVISDGGITTTTTNYALDDTNIDFSELTAEGTFNVHIGDVITVTNLKTSGYGYQPVTSVRFRFSNGSVNWETSNISVTNSTATIISDRDYTYTNLVIYLEPIGYVGSTGLETLTITHTEVTPAVKEEYITEGDLELNGDNQVTAIDGHTLAAGSNYTAGQYISIDSNDVISVTGLQIAGSYATTSDISDMATQTWVGNQGYLTAVPSNYVTETELTGVVSGFATKTELNGKQNTLTGITDVQVVNALPASPVATVLYLIPEV